MKIIYQYKKRAIWISYGSFIFLMYFLSACNEHPTSSKNKSLSSDVDNSYVKSSVEFDSSFITTAAKVNLEQIQLGQLAQIKGNMQQVKDLGKHIEQDDIAILKEIQLFAGKKQITLPASLSGDGQAFYSNIISKEGDEFDKAYLNKVLDEYNTAIKKYESMSKNALDKEISRWVNLKLPILKMHLDSALAFQTVLLK